MKQYENNVDGIRVGDTVKVEGVVSVIGSHGVVFGDGLSADYDEVQVVKRRKIKVGDRVSGRDIQEHQWKRGTLLKWVGWPLTKSEPVFLLLNADATWSDTGDSSWRVEFSDFADADDPDSDNDPLYEVVYLP